MFAQTLVTGGMTDKGTGKGTMHFRKDNYTTDPIAVATVDVISAEQAAVEAGIKAELADAVLKDGTKARFVMPPVGAEGYEITKSGIIFIKENTDDITAENALAILQQKGIDKPTSDPTASKALNVTPVDDNTIWAVGYVTVTKDGKTSTFYSDVKSAKISELK